jgi:ferredoxin
VDMGILAAGRDAMALDTLMMGLIGTGPEKDKPLAAAMRRGMSTGRMEDLDILGDDPGALRYSGFQLPTKKDISEHVPEFVAKQFGSWMSLRPLPIEGKCTACRKCVESCPASAIAIEGKIARVDLKKCVRCYCCHELCEQDAIALDRPLLMRLIGMNKDL